MFNSSPPNIKCLLTLGNPQQATEQQHPKTICETSGRNVHAHDRHSATPPKKAPSNDTDTQKKACSNDTQNGMWE